MRFSIYTEALDFIGKTEKIDFDSSFNLSQLCSRLLSKRDTEHLGRDLIIRVQNSWNKLPSTTKTIWNDLTEAAGLYPYVEPKALSDSALLRHEFHKSPALPEVYLHQEQQVLSLNLLSKNSVVVSAPTSFGKSLLIEEVIASKIYKQIVIIQPTLALLDETRKNLLKYKESYKIIVSTNQEPDATKGNVFLFTGERVVEYSMFPKIDFFVIDEFYKLSLDRDDDRAITLNQAFHKLLKQTNKFYLLGPMIKDIPLSFQEKYQFLWFPTQFATVAVDEINLENLDKIKLKEKKELKKKSLFELLLKTEEPTLIYCSSPNRATNVCLQLLDFIQAESKKGSVIDSFGNKEMIDWIRQNLHSKWSLIEAINYGIGFHHGALPRHLGSSLVDAFNEGKIRWLFCTSTLIEGVNTSAKNVILFDKEKGKKKIDFFDYKNIAGRSGRMKKHFIGNVYRFEKQPDQMELFVDIPLFNQENAPLEVLINLEENEVEEIAKRRLADFNNLDEDLKTILRKNSALNIEGQRKIVEILSSNINTYHSLLNWTGFPPSFDSLSIIIELCWEHLTKPEERNMFIDRIGRLSARWLASFTFSYINNKSISALISTYINDRFWIEKIPDEKERVNIATFTMLHITRHWFDYKLPKWLAVFSSLQEYVFTKNKLPVGNYTFLASNLEHGFLPPNLAAMMEYGIPASAINKLSAILNDSRTPEMLITFINQLSDPQLIEKGLIPYEIKKIRMAN